MIIWVNNRIRIANIWNIDEFIHFFFKYLNISIFKYPGYNPTIG